MVAIVPQNIRNIAQTQQQNESDNKISFLKMLINMTSQHHAVCDSLNQYCIADHQSGFKISPNFLQVYTGVLKSMKSHNTGDNTLNSLIEKEYERAKITYEYAQSKYLKKSLNTIRDIITTASKENNLQQEIDDITTKLDQLGNEQNRRNRLSKRNDISEQTKKGHRKAVREIQGEITGLVQRQDNKQQGIYILQNYTDHSAKQLENNIITIVNDVAKALRNPGSQVTYPGGWKGHAIYLTVCNKGKISSSAEDNVYRVKIFNLGDGIEHMRRDDRLHDRPYGYFRAYIVGEENLQSYIKNIVKNNVFSIVVKAKQEFYHSPSYYQPGNYKGADKHRPSEHRHWGEIIQSGGNCIVKNYFFAVRGNIRADIRAEYSTEENKKFLAVYADQLYFKFFKYLTSFVMSELKMTCNENHDAGTYAASVTAVSDAIRKSQILFSGVGPQKLIKELEEIISQHYPPMCTVVPQVSNQSVASLNTDRPYSNRQNDRHYATRATTGYSAPIASRERAGGR